MNNQGKTKNTFGKAILIGIIAIAIIGIIGAVVVVVSAKKHEGQGQGDTSQTNEFESDYSNAMKLFKVLCGRDILVDNLKEEARKINLEIEILDGIDGQKNIYVKDSDDYISFTNLKEEPDSPDTAVDFKYIDIVNEEESFIIKSGENTYQHFDGRLTTEFETVEDALNYHLSIHEQQ